MPALSTLKIETIADILSLIRKNVESPNELLAAHSRTLLGPRERGSTTRYGLDHLPKDRKVYRCKNSCIQEGCLGYKFHAPELEGVILCVTLPEALALSDGVISREGEHGPELVAVNPSRHLHNAASDDAETIWVIIGTYEDEPAVFTWHPGAPLIPYVPDKMFQLLTAVKLY